VEAQVVDGQGRRGQHREVGGRDPDSVREYAYGHLALGQHHRSGVDAEPADLRRGCGDERTRTADPLLAKQVLYQLSYVPVLTWRALERSSQVIGTSVEDRPISFSDRPALRENWA
jgi:hypothetical protein